nr:uncharacterized protein LOC117859705 [Setaria viridis]
MLARVRSEGGIRTLGNLFHGATINPSTKQVLSNRGIHGSAARRFNGMQPASAGSVRRAKRISPSNASTRLSRRAKTPARQARWDPMDAQLAAYTSQCCFLINLEWMGRGSC